MTKAKRLQVYSKYDGHCAYCGKVIAYKDMQVDHICPQRLYSDKKVADRIENLNPSCRRCNHYKRTASVELFREMLKTLHKRTQKIYICKVAEDYGIIRIEPWDGKFYFEKARGRNETNFIQHRDGQSNSGRTKNHDEKSDKGQGHYE